MRALPRLAAAFLIAASATIQAGPFTPGNVVVYRVGTGGPILTQNGNPVFLDEYTRDGAFVQTIALPTAGSGAQKALVASGTASSDGLLTRSADGTCLAVPGYGRDLGTGSGNLTSGTIVGALPIPRVVARVTASTAIDVSTSLGDAATGTNFRGAASNDCSGFWVAGNAGGVRHAALGATSSVNVAAGLNTERGVAIFSGQLYVASPSAVVDGVAAIGSGLPTAAAQPITKLNGTAAATSAYSFFLADLDPSVPGNDTLYVADDGLGLMKFSLVGGTWTPNGTVGPGTDAYRGLTATVLGKTVTLFATRKGGSAAAGGGELVKLVDSSGHNAPLTGTPTVLFGTPVNTALRGVALVPGVVTITPSAGPNGSIDPATPQVVPGAVARAFNVTPAPGYTAGVTGCDGTLDGTRYTTALATVSCSVVATFARVTHKVTPSAGANGTITPGVPRDIPEDATTVFSVVPAPGYRATVAGSCGGTLDGTVYTTAAIVADCSVEAAFTLITYAVTSSAGANGSITPSGTQLVTGATTAAFSVVPAHGFGASVTGCGGSLSGTTYTTAPVNSACAVEATFAPLPRYTVNASSNAHGSISPAGGQVVIAGDTASISITPDAGYSYAVRGTCGGSLAGNVFTTRPASADCTVSVTFARRLVLFVGNSYTFGRIDPVMSYNAANVSDLTLQMWLDNPVGSNEDEPHPWGGIPGIFKKMTDQLALDYDVSISARNAASLRGHYLNSNPAGWDLRGNIASQRWDAVVLQDLSDEPLPAGRGANANLPYFNAYVDRIVSWIHAGAAETYTESQLFGGSTEACRAITGASAAACDTPRVVPFANGNANPAAQVFLYETWARPDMIAPNGTNANGHFYSAAEGLEAMTADFHASYFARAAANPGVEDVSAVGDAFLRAVQSGVAMRDPYVPEAGKVNLWWIDHFHPSKYGSYLSALVHFATLTGSNPLVLGPGEQAAAGLGIAPSVAVQLQHVAQATVAPDVTAPSSTAITSQSPNAQGWNAGDVTVTFTAADEARGSGLAGIDYVITGAQAASGTLASGASLTVSAEGVSTLTYQARDRAGNVEAAHTLRFAIDKSAPVISGMPGAACSLWPPNRKMVEVATIAADAGAAPLATLNVAVSSNEPPAAGESDVAIAGSGATRTLALRADRSAHGTGRVYSITVSAIDAAGNSASATATCRVPRDQGK